MADDNKHNNDPGNPRDGGPGRGPVGPNLRMTRGIGIWVVLLLLLALLIGFIKNTAAPPVTKDISDFWTHLQNNQIKDVTIKDSSIVYRITDTTGTTAGAKTDQFRVEFPRGGMEMLLSALLKERPDNPIPCRYEPENNVLFQILAGVLPWVVIFAVIYFFIFRQLRNSAAGGGMLGNFGRSKHRVSSKDHTNISFDDVAGVEEAKEEVQEIVEFLKNPKKFQRLGGRIPRGILLVGEPGCGKTLLAKAIAGEADVPFFSISGSDFVEMFVGVGASRVRDLFKQAKDNAPCIIFLDEIDAVGRRRGSGFNGGGHDEREQTLNAILVEMDGFDTNDQVIVIAATNRRDVLDPALTRPGRFDREVYVPLPDVKGRFEILKVHAKKVKMAPNIDMYRLARGTPMFSGADLAAIINEAAIRATMVGKDWVEMEDLEEARDKVRWGRAKKSRVVDEKEKKITAYHEAGHALMQSLSPDADPLHKVSIIPRGPAGGATFSLPEKDRMVYGRKYCMALIRICVSGRIAEEMIFEESSSGAAGDIQQATNIARRMVVDWGMSDKLGMVRYGSEPVTGWFGAELGPKEYSDRTADIIDSEVRQIIDGAYSEAEATLKANRDLLDKLAQALLKYETLDADDVNRLIKGQEIEKPTVADLIEAERQKTVRARPATPPPAAPEIGPGAIPQPG